MADASSEPRPDSVGPASSSPSAPARGRERRTKQLACVACRQGKLKCVRAGRGQGCEQCRRKGLHCEIDADYKRVNQSAKLRHLSEEVRRLNGLLAPSGTYDEKQARDVNSTQYPSGGTALFHHEGTASGLNEPYVESSTRPATTVLHTSPRREDRLDAQRHDTGQDASVKQSIASLCSTGYALEGIKLTPEQVLRLFQIFFQHFHPHFPVLSENIHAAEYHERSPLLFWTIIATASRASRERPELCTVLSQPVAALLWAKIAAIPPSHFTIQAAILLCLWPFPPPTMIADPTLFLASIAKAGCMQLGMHQPENMQDYNRVRFEIQPTHIQEATRLWASAFIAAQTITSADGHVPLFSIHDKALSRAAAADGLPALLKQVLKVQMVSNRLFSTMAETCAQSSTQRSSLGPLIASFDNELEQLQENVSGRDQEYVSIWITAARVHIQALYFLEPVDSTYRRTGLLRAFASAVGLVRLLHTANMQPNFNHSAPRYFGQALKLAALIVLRLQHSSYSLSLDGDESRHYFDLAVNLHRSMIVEKNDFHDRAAIFLLDLWKIFDHDQDTRNLEPHLKVHTRQSASLLHDSQWVWRDHYSARSIDTQQLGRPPRILPSIIQYSPASNTEANSPAASKNRPGPARLSSRPGFRGAEDALAPGRANPTADSEELAHGGTVGGDQAPSAGRRQASASSDLPLDPLDMMYAFLDPNDEASELFYPPWAVDNERS